MSVRRLERAILATPYALKTVSSLVFNVASECPKFNDFNVQFLPMLRYHNPKLKLEVQVPSSGSSSLVVKFTDNSQDVVEMDKVVQSHHLMEILLQIDALKHSMKDNTSLNEALTTVIHKYNFLDTQLCEAGGSPRECRKHPRYAHYGHDLKDCLLLMEDGECEVELTQSLLGAGSTGAVFEGVDTISGQKVAVKLPHFDVPVDEEDAKKKRTAFRNREHSNLSKMSSGTCPYVTQCIGKLKIPSDEEPRFHLIKKIPNEGEEVVSEISKEGVVMECVQGGREDHYISLRPGNREELEGHFIQVALLAADLVRRGLKHNCLHTWNLLLRHDQIFKYGNDKEASRMVMTSYYALAEIFDTWIEKLVAFSTMVHYYLFYVELLADKDVLTQIAHDGAQSDFAAVLADIIEAFRTHEMPPAETAEHHYLRGSGAAEVAEISAILDSQHEFLEKTFRNDGHPEEMDHLTIVPAFRKLLAAYLQ